MDEASKLLSKIHVHDPEAIILDGGGRGSYLKVHNQEAEAAATAERRDFPLA